MRVKWLQSTADCIIDKDSEWQIVPARGEPVRADVVILATGNEAPRPISARLAPQLRPFVLDDPWDTASKELIAHDERILLLGTGLTAIDVAIELSYRGHTGHIYTVSRRGLLPRCHAPANAPSDGCGATLPTSVRALVRHIRALVAHDLQGRKWQSFVNELRSIAPTLWARWSPSERRRFLRHVRPFWDVHRHRIAPQVNWRIARAQARGRLTISRGRIHDIELLATGDTVRVQVRESGRERLLDVERVINCTGPEMDPRRALNPLLQSLVGDSLAQADPLGLGLVVDQQSRVVAADGTAHRTLYALGPLTRGSRWEVTAIAEIRDQASDVARTLARDFAVAPALLSREWDAGSPFPTMFNVRSKLSSAKT